MKTFKKSTSKYTLKWLFQQVRTARGWVLLSIALGSGGGILLIVQAWLLANIVHGAFMDDLSHTVLRPFFAALLTAVILRAVLGWGREVAGCHAGARVREEVRMALLEHIFFLGPAYTSRQRTGALASTAIEYVEGLHDFYAFYLPQLALAVMIPAAILAFVFPLSWAAGTIFLVTAPLIPLFMILVGMGAESVSQRHFQALARISAHFLDTLQGITTLKLFDRSRGEEKMVAEVSSEYRKRTMSVLRIAFLSSAVLEFFSSIAIALVAVYLGMSYLGYIHFGDYGEPLTLGAGLFILLLAPDFYLQLRELGAHYHARAEAMGAAEEILKVLAIPCPAAAMGSRILEAQGPIHIDCQDLYFSYEQGKRPTLSGVNFKLNGNEKVALVGSSGAGKTTMLNLLLGFLHPDRGRILVNGAPLTDLAPESWRQHIGWIGQNPILFHGTIRENILLGRPQASEAEIEQAARSARVLDFTMHLPAGLDTLVGEQGLGLSRGQSQRVALARAFLKDAPVLLLDEPTAGLDSENERLVMSALQKLSQARTVLMLTHRLENIEKADRIVVLLEGKVVEEGTYTELIGTKGVFQRLAHRADEEKNRAEA